MRAPPEIRGGTAREREDRSGRLRVEEGRIERIALLAGLGEMHQSRSLLRPRNPMHEPFLEPCVLERARHIEVGRVPIATFSRSAS